MFLFKKESKTDAKNALESLERAQKVLDERFEKGQVPVNVYQKQCEEFGKRRDKLRKILGEEYFEISNKF